MPPLSSSNRGRRILLGMGGAVLAGAGLFFGSGDAPSFDATREGYRPSERRLLDREGEVLTTLRTDYTIRRLGWTRLNDISPALLAAVVRVEDRRFYGHSGVDLRALFAALGATLAGHPRGASTITMQTARLLRPQKGGAVGRKLRQMREAWALERAWSKEEILEAYLNLVSFRGELQGVGAASWGLYGKAPSGLDRYEAGALAAMVALPSATPERVARRAVDERYRIVRNRDLAPHVARLLLRGGEGDVRSTLRGEAQRFALATLRRQVGSLRDRNVADGALIAVENGTGAVVAYVGSLGAGASAPSVDGVRARRQAGSTLKPFLYALALERGLLTPGSLLRDAPFEKEIAGGVYRPQNYDRRYRGVVTVATALASSLNVPAVRTAELVGPVRFHALLRQLGFTLPHEADHYGLALALGGAEVSLWELAGAYRTLARGGAKGELFLSPGGEEETTPLFTGKTAGAIGAILADPEARTETFGSTGPLTTPFRAAVKTGTSKDMKDNWCVGFTDEYTVAVWIGNFSGEPMRNVTGVSGAGPVWREMIGFLNGEKGAAPPPLPAFPVAEAKPAVAPLRIVYPGDGVLFAIDPDIPDETQKIPLQASREGEVVRWNMDGTDLPEPTPLWTPTRGRHTLTLKGGDGAPLDTVRFTVR